MCVCVCGGVTSRLGSLILDDDVGPDECLGFFLHGSSTEIIMKNS